MTELIYATLVMIKSSRKAFVSQSASYNLTDFGGLCRYGKEARTGHWWRLRKKLQLGKDFSVPSSSGVPMRFE
jgi:hypothetical protein